MTRFELERGADRRHPRAEALPAGQARDPARPEGARGAARRGQAARGAAQEPEGKRWTLVKDELEEIKKKYADKRRTKVVGDVDEPEFGEEDFIVDEDANVVLSAQGWVKRVREVKDLSTTRLREGDSVLAVVAGSTRAAVAFFSNLGGCYVARIHDVPASTGYGDPVQKLFKLDDGERMVAMLSLRSARARGARAHRGRGRARAALRAGGHRERLRLPLLSPPAPGALDPRRPPLRQAQGGRRGARRHARRRRRRRGLRGGRRARARRRGRRRSPRSRAPARARS